MENKKATAIEILNMHITHNAWLKGITPQQRNFIVMAMEEYGSSETMKRDEELESFKKSVLDLSFENAHQAQEIEKLKVLIESVFRSKYKYVQPGSGIDDMAEEMDWLEFASKNNLTTMNKHPEDTCEVCGNYNPRWTADNELFNKVNGSPNGIMCPTCFANIAEGKGINIKFVGRSYRINYEFPPGQDKCHICGGGTVLIRGRVPQEKKRSVCPVCTMERLEQIQKIVDPNYGRTYKNDL